MTTKQKPSFIAYTVTGEGKKASWTRVGAAWPHAKAEGFNIELNALPLNGRIVLMLPKAQDQEVAE